MLKRGDIATMYHEGSDSYAEVVVLRPMSKADVAAETDAATGNAPRTKQPPISEKRAQLIGLKQGLARKKPVVRAKTAVELANNPDGLSDTALLKQIVDRVLGWKNVTVYNDLNAAKNQCRLKIWPTIISDAQYKKVRKPLVSAFGHKFVEIGRVTNMFGNQHLFIRLVVR